MLRITRIAILIIAFCLGSGPTAGAKDFAFESQKVFAVGEKAELELNYFEGNLQITSHDVNRIVIKATRRVSAVGMDEARELAENIVLKTDQAREKLAVNTSFLQKIERNSSLWNKLFGGDSEKPYGTIDFDILVPENCSINLSNNTGSISVSNLRSSVRIRSSASDIHLSGIEGPVTIDNASGKTTGEMLFGPVTLYQPLGEIALEWIEGDIRIKSASAKIDIRQEKGSIDLVNTTGPIKIQTNLFSSQDNFVTTESGNVELMVPVTASGQLAIASDLGNIKTDMPIKIKSVTRKQLVGEFGDGGVTFHVNSTTGDVSVAQF